MKWVLLTVDIFDDVNVEGFNFVVILFEVANLITVVIVDLYSHLQMIDTDVIANVG